MRVVVGALMLLSVVSCGTGERLESPVPPADAPYAHASPELVAPPDQSALGSLEVQRAVDYGNAWPFTVEDGRLECSGGAVVLVADQRRYGLNDAARRAGEPAPDEIMVRDNDTKEPQIGYGTIVERGLRFCD